MPRLDGRILAGATIEDAGFEKEVTGEGVDFLLAQAFEISPSIANLEINEKWSGLRPFAAGGWPVIGAIPGAENLFAATAHYRNGILLAPITGETLADKIVKNVESRYLRIFGPRARTDQASKVRSHEVG